jgi:hypothetical protein
MTRPMFQALGRDGGVEVIQFECVLSEVDEHRRRVEARSSTDQHNPTWEDAVHWKYEPWDVNLDGHRTVMDMKTTEAAAARIKEMIQ